jgi:hypothetical protein
MTERHVFESAKALWNDPLDISDAETVGEDGFSAPSLWEGQEKASQCAGTEEGLIAASVWPFHQALSSVAVEAHRSGRTTISPTEVQFGDFRKWLLITLDDESWSSAKLEWERLSK